MTRSVGVLFFGLALVSAAAAQDAPPAVAENLKEPEKKEFATPQSTIDMMRLALFKVDAAGFKNCFHNGDDGAAKFVDAFGDMTISMRALTKLASEKFKDDADAAKLAKTAAEFADSME